MSTTDIYETHREEFVRRLVAAGCREDLAEDAVQEAAIELWQHGEAYGPGLLWRRVKSRADDLQRALSTKVHHEEQASRPEGYVSDVDWELDHARAIARLTDRQRQAADLRSWGATTTEVGDALGVSRQRVNQILAAAETAVWEAIAG